MTLAFAIAAALAICIYLECNGAYDRLRNANIAFANLAVLGLALATLWPHTLRGAIATRVAHHLLFVGYACAFAHYVCSFALLADEDYLGFARTHPLGVILAIFSSLFVLVLSVQCVAQDSKVKAFAIRINGVILALFTAHQALLNYEAVLARGGPDVAIAIATFAVCVACLALYVIARVRRR